MTAWDALATPLGELLLVAGDDGLRAVILPGRGTRPPDARRDPDALAAAREQLSAYFAGRRRAFALALAPAGTPFQRAVWAAVAAIPYGHTTTYAALAAALGRGPRAARAVGAANARNPLAVVIPCHRVVGSDGALTGYAGGLDAKRRLLALEHARIA